MSTVPQQSSLLSTVLEAGVSKACFHVATELIFEELSAGRGVTLPGLGTFTIDVKERFLGTGRGTKADRTPFLQLSAHYESLGVRPPAQKPSGATPTHMIGWQALASRCGVDRDLAQRAVAQTLAAFSSKVAAMSTSEARSALCLDLGPCGKLRIVRAGGMKTSFEPRVAFSEALLLAIHRGEYRPVFIGSVPLKMSTWRGLTAA